MPDELGAGAGGASGAASDGGAAPAFDPPEGVEGSGWGADGAAPTRC
jgi:hypothetical protein